MDHVETLALMQHGDPGPTAFEQLTRRPAWHRHAACRGQGPDRWFPNLGGDGSEAKAVCHTCPVQSDCLDWSLTQDASLDGVFAGLARTRRNQLRRSAKGEQAA